MKRMSLAWLPVMLLMVTPLAGCLELVGEDDPARPTRTYGKAPATTAPATGGNMTGAQDGDAPTTAALCPNVGVPPENTYCAKKTIKIKGTIEGLTELPVSLATFAGALDVQGRDGSDWNLDVVLEARGSSEAVAKTNLDNIDFQWSHVDGDGHHLKATAKKKQQNVNHQESASMTLKIPKGLELFFSAANSAGSIKSGDLTTSRFSVASSSGSIEATNVRAIWASLSTASGAIKLTKLGTQELGVQSSSGSITLSDVEATDVSVATSSGSIEAQLRGVTSRFVSSSGSIELAYTPLETGSLSATVASGSIQVTLPEGSKYGYSIDASTASGSVDIDLKDGTTTGKDRSKKFTSTNYAAREIRASADFAAASGSIQVAPA